MRYLLVILLSLIGFNGYSQAVSLYGATRPEDTSKTRAQLVAPVLATSDSNKVIGVTSTGQFVLRTKVAPSNFLQKSDTARNGIVATNYFVDSLFNTVGSHDSLVKYSDTLTTIGTKADLRAYRARLLSDTAFGEYILLNIDPYIIHDNSGAISIQGRIENLPMGLANGHSVVSRTNFARDGGSYAVYSAFDSVSASNVGHSTSFQDIMRLVDSADVGYHASFFGGVNLRHNSRLDEYRGLYVEGITRSDLTASAGVQYGVKIKNLDAADTNWAIYTEGTTRSYFGGNIRLNRIKITNSTDSVLSTDTNGEVIPVSLSGYLKKADTATMLSPYLRKVDTASLSTRIDSKVPLTRTITINGNTQALSSDVSYTIATGITSLNSLTGATQTFATGTSGSDFNISSTGTTHTFNIPSASATARGLVTTGTQTIAGAKTFSSDLTVNGNTIGRGPGNIAGNIALGSAALFSNTTGSNNVGIGNVGGGLITTGSNNIGIGFRSLGSSGARAVTGSNNTGIGNNACANVGTGTNNVGIGPSALGNTSTGLNNNVGIGGNALANISGGNNVGIGVQSYQNGTGTDNVSIGTFAGSGSTPVTSNVFIGAASGFSTASSNNTFVGEFSGGNVTSGANNTYLGRFRGTGFETSSNQIFLSDGSQNVRMRFNGAFGMIGSSTDDGSNRELQITGQLGVTDTVVAPRMRETAITSAILGTTSDGTHYAASISASATLDFPSTLSLGESDLTMTVTGAADGDVVSLGVPSGSAGDGSFFAYVSATNTVTVRFINHLGSPVDPASGTFKVIVFK